MEMLLLCAFGCLGKINGILESILSRDDLGEDRVPSEEEEVALFHRPSGQCSALPLCLHNSLEERTRSDSTCNSGIPFLVAMLECRDIFGKRHRAGCRTASSPRAVLLETTTCDQHED